MKIILRQKKTMTRPLAYSLHLYKTRLTHNTSYNIIHILHYYINVFIRNVQMNDLQSPGLYYVALSLDVHRTLVLIILKVLPIF